MYRLFSIILCLLPLCFWGCSDVTPEKKAHVYISELQEDGACGFEQALPHLGTRTQVWMAGQDGSLEKIEYDLSSYSGRGLTGPAVVSASVRIKAGDSALTFPFICRESGGYSPDSLENSVLAATVSLDIASKYYARQFGERLKPVRLGMWLRTRDNASFSGGGDEGQISFDAHSKEFLQRNKVTYVQLLGVAAHEYGHYVLRFPSLDLSGLSKDLQIVFSQVRRGLDEGFADYYSSEVVSSSLNFGLSKRIYPEKEPWRCISSRFFPGKYALSEVDKRFSWKVLHNMGRACLKGSEAYFMGAIWAARAKSLDMSFPLALGARERLESTIFMWRSVFVHLESLLKEMRERDSVGRAPEILREVVERLVWVMLNAKVEYGRKLSDVHEESLLAWRDSAWEEFFTD